MSNAKKTVTVESLSAEERGRLIGALKEASAALARAEGERDYINTTKKKIAEDLKLPAKLVGRLVKVYHKQNFDEEHAANEEFEKLYLHLTTKGQN